MSISSTTVYHRNPNSRLGALPSGKAASHLGVSPSTLANWRVLGYGPKYVRFGAKGARVYYRIADLEAWLQEHTVGGDA